MTPDTSTPPTPSIVQTGAAAAAAAAAVEPATRSVSGHLPWKLASGDWLSEDDADRIGEVMDAAYATTTREVYAFAWRRFTTWCERRGIEPLPADPVVVCAYLVGIADQGRSLATVDSACSAIGHQHHTNGEPDPTEQLSVKLVRRGLRRLLGRAPRRPAHPLSVTELRLILTAIDRSTASGARDAAILLIGYAGALRRSELAALELADLDPTPDGLLVSLRHSKTDQDGRGHVIGIAPGRDAQTDPIAALEAWLGLRGRTPGPVFTSLQGGRPSLVAVSGQVISRVVKERASAAGLGTNPTGVRVTAHSLRAGHATTAALAGVSLDRIAAQTRHRRLDVLHDRYIHPGKTLERTSSRHLGL